MSSNPSPKINRKSQRLHSLILASFLISAAMASGCRWDDSLYKKYPGPVTCTGYCVGVENLDKDGCLSLNGTWHPDDCINEVLPEVEGEDEVIKPAANEEECIAHSGNWKPGYCEISKTVCQEKVKIENSEIEYNKGYCMGAKELTQEECEKELTDGKPIGKWDNDHCVIDDLRCQDIHSSLENIQWLELEWHALDYRILDIGEGEYIRCVELNESITESEESIEKRSCKQFTCGTMAQITSNNPPACDESKTKYKQAVADMEESLPGSICRKDAATCVEVKKLPPNENGDGIGMCSSCPQDNLVCENECVNVMNDSKNCGGCGVECDPGGSCDEGVCKYNYICQKGLIECGIEVNEKIIQPLCFDPSNPKQCGAECIIVKENEDVKCPPGKTCDKVDETHYLAYTACFENSICNENNQCECPIKPSDGDTLGRCNDGTEQNPEYRCLAPSKTERCGESLCSGNGTNCDDHPGTSCRINAFDTYECQCKGWELACTIESTINCINPAINPSYCGLEDCSQIASHAACSLDSFCDGGECVCNDENMIICGGKCISPLEDKNNCGACGNKCTSNERCIGGSCVCSEKEVEMIINGERRCANPKENEYCNIHINDDNEIIYENCSEKNMKCQKESDGVYRCACKDDFIECDGVCINPMTNPDYCGAKDDCELVSERGEKCKNNEVCSEGECNSTCNAGNANCNGECVSMSDYHINTSCTRCNGNYCYTGEMDLEGNPINFDYHLCLTKNDSNKLNSVNYCGGCNLNSEATKNKGAVCGEHMKCDKNDYNKDECMCDDGYISCKIQNSKGEIEEVCLNNEDNHITLDSEGECVCQENYDDCNNDMRDGCEIDLLNTTDHCGTCETNCSSVLQNAWGFSCNNGTCSYKQCLEGYGNCNASSEPTTGVDGCEYGELNTDPKNCGKCGYACSGEGCNVGSCCWSNTKYTMDSISNSDCCPGMVVWVACDKNPFRSTRYTCSPSGVTPSISHGDVACSWSEK